MKLQRRRRRLRYVEITKESVVGEREPVLLLAHFETAADGHMEHLPEELLRKSGQFWLSFRIRSGDDQAHFFVKDLKMPLAVEIVLIMDGLRADKARETDHPLSGFAHTRRNAKTAHVIRLILWDGRFRAGMIV